MGKDKITKSGPQKLNREETVKNEIFGKIRDIITDYSQISQEHQPALDALIKLAAKDLLSDKNLEERTIALKSAKGSNKIYVLTEVVKNSNLVDLDFESIRFLVENGVDSKLFENSKKLHDQLKHDKFDSESKDLKADFKSYYNLEGKDYEKEAKKIEKVYEEKYKEVKSNHNNIEKDIKEIAKNYEASYKNEEFASKEEALELIKLFRKIADKDSGFSEVGKVKLVEINEFKFFEKNDKKLSKDTFKEIFKLAKDIEDKQQEKPNKSFIKELIDGIKNIFKSEEKKQTHNHRKEVFGKLDDQDFKKLKKDLNKILKSDDQKDLTHENTRNSNKSKPKPKPNSKSR